MEQQDAKDRIVEEYGIELEDMSPEEAYAVGYLEALKLMCELEVADTNTINKIDPVAFET